VTLHASLFAAAAILGGGAAIADGLLGRHETTAVALAEAIVSGEMPRVFDLRTQAEFEAFHVPSSTRTTLRELMALGLPRTTRIVLYSGETAEAARASMLLRLRGYRDVSFLRQGLYEWIARVHEPSLAVDATAGERAEFERLAALSRHFGGQPRVDVPRADLPAGYWTAGGGDASRSSMSTDLLVAAIRRRGC
jgi:rhodanese-related sulfurtransferase